MEGSEMKLAENIIKIGLASATVAGIAYLVVKYMDAIKAWLEKLCPACEIEEEAIEEAAAVEIAAEPVAEEAPAVEEVPAVEETAAEETPVVEEVVVEDGTPVAEEADFEA